MLIVITSLLLSLMAARPPPPNVTNIRTLPVPPTPESSTTELKLAIPQNGQVTSAPVTVQFRIDGFALGAASQFDRADEIANSEMGQTVHVIIDDHPYFPINEPAVNAYDESGYYYNMSYQFKIPYRLDQGMHTIRMFPARSYGESLKGDNSFVAIDFYVGSYEKTMDVDLKKPYLTYNEPSSLMPLKENQPVLLDFYITNAELSSNGYKVRLSIDGKFHSTLTSWQPYYIFGLKKGRHKVRLQLINSANEPVPGTFNDVTEVINIY